MGEESVERKASAAALYIFIIVTTFQFLSRWLEQLKKKASKSSLEVQLREEIKKLLKEANALAGPSTFAQAAKLRRQAAAKEKELANHLESRNKEVKLSYDMYLKVLFFSKVVVYLMLIFWFWRAPVAIVSQQLVQPFGKLLSWRTGGSLNNHVMVGIIPWLVISSRVSKFVCRALEMGK